MNLLQTVSFSERLAQAEEKGNVVKPLTEMYPGISIRDAYMIQLKTIERKVEAGATIIGKNRLKFAGNAKIARSRSTRLRTSIEQHGSGKLRGNLST